MGSSSATPFARNKLFAALSNKKETMEKRNRNRGKKKKKKKKKRNEKKETRTQLELTITSIHGTRLDDDVLALTGATTIARRGVVAGSPSYSGTIETACGPGGPA